MSQHCFEIDLPAGRMFVCEECANTARLMKYTAINTLTHYSYCVNCGKKLEEYVPEGIDKPKE